MPFNLSSVTPAVLAQITMGHATDNLSIFEGFFEVNTIETMLKGSFDAMTSASLLIRNESRDLAPGEENKTHGGGFDNVPYEATAQVGSVILYDEARINTEAKGLNLLANRIEMCRTIANGKVDMKVADLLSNATYNEVMDVTAAPGNGAWDDYVNGTPLQDMMYAKRYKAPGANALVLTPSVADALAASPVFNSETAFYNDGQLDYGAFALVIARKLGIPVNNVLIFEELYNSAVKGQTPVIAYYADDMAWIGHRSSLTIIDPRSVEINGVSEMERGLATRSWLLQNTRYVDAVRAIKSMGCSFTNVIT